VEATVLTKKCRICGFTLPLTKDNFYVSRNNRDGFDNRCIPCFRLAETARRIARGEKPKNYLNPDSPTKVCPRCRAEKVKIDRFYPCPDTRDGFRFYCKDCEKEERDNWRSSEEVKARNKEKVREWSGNNPEKRMVSWLKSRYALTLDQYYKMWEKQDYKCAICGLPEPESVGKKFCIDHCHDTGVVRGLLCFGCNTMLGNAQDDPEILQNAIDYLKKFPKDSAPVVESETKEKT
jgi:hypothetical protein